MVRAYNQAAATLNLLRAFSQGGYANLHQVHAWTLDSMGRSPWAKKFGEMADHIGNALDFIAACGINPDTVPQLKATSFYTRDRKSVVQGKSVSLRVNLGGARIIKKKKNNEITYK